MQSFTYDAHDKLTSGTAGNESDTYDLNGSETRISLGGYVYGFTYDDEDRLVQANYPGGVVDTFVYNGLGLRVAKTDSTGSYSYLCDGASPASPVLWDGHAVYTPGLSENRGGASSYYENDRLGNLWTLDYGSGKGYSAGYNFSGFGSWVYAGGSTGNPFKFGGGNGCQTDADTGLVLMGHRYYDTRIGRFISQDPAGDGDNWYAYADNDPVDAVDPEGLMSAPTGAGMWSINGGAMTDAAAIYGMLGASGHWMFHQTGTYDDANNVTHIEGYNHWVNDGEPGLFDGVGGAFGVGFSAVGSAASFHLWDGGAARHDPSFGVSRGLADVGVAAGTAAFGGAAGAVGKAGEETVTVARWGRSGLKAGDWVMKGKANRWNYLRSFKWQPGLGNKFSSFKAGEEFQVPASSVKWPTGWGIDGWWKGLFGQRIYGP